MVNTIFIPYVLQFTFDPVLVIVDNCSAHAILQVEGVTIVRLPANVTSTLQPLDQGIISAVKRKNFRERRKIHLKFPTKSKKIRFEYWRFARYFRCFNLTEFCVAENYFVNYKELFEAIKYRSNSRK